MTRLQREPVIRPLYLDDARQWLNGTSFTQLAAKNNLNVGSITLRIYNTLNRLMDYYQIDTDQPPIGINKANKRPMYWLNGAARRLIERYEKEGGLASMTEFRERERKVADLSVREFTELMKEIINK